MDIRTLQRIIFDALEDVKAQDIRVFNTHGITDLFDRVIICSGTSNRQTRSLAMHVREKIKEAGEEIISMEGEETGEWVLVDAGDAVVHIMQPAIRQYYNLEELWGQKAVDVKAETEAEKTANKLAKKTDGSPKPAPKKKPASKAKADIVAEAPKKVAAKKPAAKATAPKATASKSTGSKSTAAKVLAAKKPAAKKPVAKKAAVKK